MSTDENKPTETRPAPTPPETRPAQQPQAEKKALTGSGGVLETVEALTVTGFSVAGTAQIVKNWKQPPQAPPPQASASEQAPAPDAPAE
jgi:hypothetical protein